MAWRITLLNRNGERMSSIAVSQLTNRDKVCHWFDAGHIWDKAAL
jgi:hypothetical protein